MIGKILFVIALGSAVLVGVGASVTAGARADIVQPYCLSGGGGLMDHCDFGTFAQCQATAGLYGVCSPNPNYPPPSAPAQRPLSKRGKQ